MSATKFYGRNWCFTSYHDTVSVSFSEEEVSYAVWQLEKCPTTQRAHWQGYVQCRRKLRLNGVKRLFPDHPTVHLDGAKGSAEQNIAYCSKEESRLAGPFFFGDSPVSSGQRSDLDAVKAALAAGKSDQEIRDDHFAVWIRYPNLVSRYRAADDSPRDGPHTCILLFGGPGTGKSLVATREYPDAYIKPSGKWWEGYDGETTVIFDDFSGADLSFGDFKRAVDRYPLRVEIKGASRQLASTTTVITSNLLPSEWWQAKVLGSHGLDAIKRRLTTIWWFKHPGAAYGFSSYDSFLAAYSSPVPVVGTMEPYVAPQLHLEVFVPELFETTVIPETQQ